MEIFHVLPKQNLKTFSIEAELKTKLETTRLFKRGLREPLNISLLEMYTAGQRSAITFSQQRIWSRKNIHRCLPGVSGNSSPITNYPKRPQSCTESAWVGSPNWRDTESWFLLILIDLQTPVCQTSIFVVTCLACWVVMGQRPII